jgi:hypothetical protein
MHHAVKSAAFAIGLISAACAMPSIAKAECREWTATKSGPTEQEARQRAIYAANMKFNETKASLIPKYGDAQRLNQALAKGSMSMEVKCWDAYTCKAVKTWCG